MKTICFSWLLAMGYYTNAENVYKLSEAIKQGLVSITMSGAKPDSAEQSMFLGHYGPCMQMEVLNKNAFTVSLDLEYGYKLEPQDTNLQTMMVTQALVVKLQPKQKKLEKIYAMCTEATDGSPSWTANYYMGKRANGNLLGLAGLIDQKKYQNDAAQNAIWCLTNNHDIFSIYSTDTTMMFDLRRFIAKAKGLPLSKIYEVTNGYSYTPAATYTARTIYSGSLTYSLSKSSKIMLALFDEDNHMKTVYVNDEVQREGEYTYNYKIGSDEMGSKKHYLRMFRDGKMEEEIAIIPRE